MPLNGQQYHSRELCDAQQFFVDLKMYKSETKNFLTVVKTFKNWWLHVKILKLNFRYFTEYYFALGTENLFILFLNVKPNKKIQESYLK